jgi:peptide chain release factor 2
LLQLHNHAMIELNPIRQRIADLRGRLDSLRGYL